MAITLQQSTGVRIQSTSFTLPFSAANSGGNLLTLVVGVGGNSPAGKASTVTDSAGNNWQLAADCQSSFTVQIWYAENCVGNTNTLTITNSLSGAVTFNCQLSEWSGVSTAASLIGASSHALPTAVSTHTPGAISVNVSTSLFLVGYNFPTQPYDITSTAAGYTVLSNSTFTTMRPFYRIVSGSTTTENPEMISSAAEISFNAMAAFAGGAAVAGTATARVQKILTLGVG